MQVTPISMTIGSYRIHSVPTGTFGLDGGAMFGTVPKTLWNKANPADEFNRIQMQARALLLCGGGKNILVDTGIGQDFVTKYGETLGAKFADIYNITSTGGLKEEIRRFGLTCNDITHVILTHLHFDHAGGATEVQEGKIQPTFKKAQYFIQKRHLESAKNSNIREKASFFPANMDPLLEAGVLEVVDGPKEEILPGLSLSVSEGHTCAMQLVHVHDSNNTLVYCADLIPTSSHVRRAWIMGYDLQPLVIIKEKEELLTQAAEKNWILFFEHDPFCSAARVATERGDFKVIEHLEFS